MVLFIYLWFKYHSKNIPELGVDNTGMYVDIQIFELEIITFLNFEVVHFMIELNWNYY